jgi:hypothetical protein
MNKKRWIMALVAVAVFSGVLYAATYDYKVTIGEKEHKVLVKMLSIENDRRAALVPPQAALTEAEYVQQTFENLFAREWRRTRRRLLRKKSQSELDAAVGVN